MRVFFLFLMLCFLGTTAIFAQDRSTTSEVRSALWYYTKAKIRISDRFAISSDNRIRTVSPVNETGNILNSFNQVRIHKSINYLLSPNMELSLGGTYAAYYNEIVEEDEVNVRHEPRVWYQSVFIHPKVGRFSFYHRLRVEHRFRRSFQEGDDFHLVNRFRYRFSTYVPLNKKQLQIGSYFNYTSAEIFMQAGERIVRNPYEDFRFHTAFGSIVSKNLKVMAGYVWRYGQLDLGHEYRQFHMIRIDVAFSFDVRSRKGIP